MPPSPYLSISSQGWGIRLAASPQPGADGRHGGVQSPHPVATGGEAVDNWPNRVQQLHPGPGTGCNQGAQRRESQDPAEGEEQAVAASAWRGHVRMSAMIGSALTATAAARP